MSKSVDLQCLCGELKGKVEVVPGSYFYVHCLCCDCQDFAGYLNNKENILDEHGGSELFQTYPALVQITAGRDQLDCVQLKEKGLYRWYTRCCQMPVGNTMSSAKVPFVGLSVKLMQFADEQQKRELLGPVILKAYGQYAIGEMPDDVHLRFPVTFLPKIIGFMLKGLFGKKHQPSPFFEGAEPVASVRLRS